MQARGEYGLNSRLGLPQPFSIKHSTYSMPNQGEHLGRDPSWAPGPGMLVNPENKLLREAGYTRWTWNKGNSQFLPFCGVHDYSDEIVEEYYRGSWAFGRQNKGNDHDEWRA